MSNILKGINPLKERKDNSIICFSIQKFLAFLLLYAVSAVVLEMLIIGGYSLFGYDILHGQMPTGDWVNRIPFYGMAGFAFFTLGYVKYVEKRSFADIGLRWNFGLLKAIVKGTVIGGGMVAVMIGILILTGLCSYQGLGEISISSFLFWLLAFFIQASAEEIMCRGYLLTSLNRRMNFKLAILISSIAFAVPHMSAISEIGGWKMVVAIINLLLVSWLFSLIMIKRNSLGAACGVHFGWNFSLGILFGLGVSGGDSTNGVFQFSIKAGHDFLTGGIQGIEASILLIPLLIICIVISIHMMRRGKQYGI